MLLEEAKRIQREGANGNWSSFRFSGDIFTDWSVRFAIAAATSPDKRDFPDWTEPHCSATC
jgi:hypothetical protein